MVHGVIHSSEDAGRIIRMAREANGYTQMQLSSELGISQRYVSELERGKSNVVIDRMFGILSDLGVEVTFTFESPK